MTSNVLTAAKGTDLQKIDQLLSQHEALWRAGSTAEPAPHYDELFLALHTLGEDVAQLRGDDLMLLERLSLDFAHAKDILAILSYFAAHRHHISSRPAALVVESGSKYRLFVVG